MAADSTETFVYEKGGVRITAPRFDDVITAGFLRKYRNSTEIEQMFAAVELALDEDNLATFDQLPVATRDGAADRATMSDFYSAWQKDAGITAGE